MPTPTSSFIPTIILNTRSGVFTPKLFRRHRGYSVFETHGASPADGRGLPKSRSKTAVTTTTLSASPRAVELMAAWGSLPSQRRGTRPV
jgi:hypothetical protein